MSSDNALTIKNVTKTYNVYARPADRFLQFFYRHRRKLYKEFTALNNVSFNIRRGETLGIVGANGAGKSTLLQIIAGTLTPTSGTVTAQGRVAALLELGAGFNPEFTGIENIKLSGRLYGLSDAKIESALDSIIEFSGIGDFVYQEVKTYSSGMYVRLAFSVIAHLDPEILIVDEALSVGDFIFQQKCARFMHSTLASVTKILVSHDLGTIAAMADRVAVMCKGQLVFIGDTQTGLAVYQKVARASMEGREVTAEMVNTNSISGNRGLGGDDEWTAISTAQTSGTGHVSITAARWAVDNQPSSKTIREGEILTVEFRVDVKHAIDNPIIGYQVQDRFGTVIFGENSISSNIAVTRLESGRHKGTMQISWPQIMPGDYGITLGVGNGLTADSHVVECWAHNIIVLSSVKTASIHGIFNHRIDQITLEQEN